MDATVQGIVLKVEGKTGKKGNVYFAVSFSDGKTYTTFDNGLAQQAQALQGQQAEAQVKQNGDFWNLVAIRGAAGAVIQHQAGAIPIAPGAPQGEQYQRRMHPDVEARVVRQNVLGTAFDFVGKIFEGTADPADLEVAKTHALELAKELFGHAFHGGGADKAETPQQPSEVAAQVNEVLGMTAVTQGAPEATKDW